MKKSELAILSVLILAAVFVFNGKINKVTNPCVQDYVAVQGTSGECKRRGLLQSATRALRSAREKDGYAVFKDPARPLPRCASTIRRAFRSSEKSSICSGFQSSITPPTKLTAGKPRPARRSAPAGPICQQVF